VLEWVAFKGPGGQARARDRASAGACYGRDGVMLHGVAMIGEVQAARSAWM